MVFLLYMFNVWYYCDDDTDGLVGNILLLMVAIINYKLSVISAFISTLSSTDLSIILFIMLLWNLPVLLLSYIYIKPYELNIHNLSTILLLIVFILLFMLTFLTIRCILDDDADTLPVL